MKILHDIRKNSYAMESGKETFHEIRKNSCTMESSKETFHDIRKNSYAMESGKETFHDIRKNSYIMELTFNPPIQLHPYSICPQIASNMSAAISICCWFRSAGR